MSLKHTITFIYENKRVNIPEWEKGSAIPDLDHHIVARDKEGALFSFEVKDIYWVNRLTTLIYLSDKVKLSGVMEDGNE